MVFCTALYLNIAAVLFDNALADPKPETRAALALGGEKRTK
jgi:hypothetical protein